MSNKRIQTYTIDTKLTEKDRERLNRVVELTGRTRTELVREAILFWLDHCEGKQLNERDVVSLQVALAPVMKALEAMNERQCGLLVRVGMDVGTQLALISSRIGEPERKEIMNQAKKYAGVRFRQQLTNLEDELRKKLARMFPQVPEVPKVS